MADQRVFQAFFSYAHHDAKTDSKLVEAITVALEDRVVSRLVNDGFTIWRDKEGVRTGDVERKN